MHIKELEVAIKNFSNLLDKNKHTRKHEQEIQTFLEKYPYFLPGLYVYHHGPLKNMVISKPPLGVDFKADFAFVSAHTAWYKFIFIEIEDPCKEIFTKKDELSSKFYQARNQLRDWVRAWSGNKEIVKSVFNQVLGPHLDMHKLMGFKGYLVCGRRSDVESSPLRIQNWAEETKNWGPGVDVEVMTYDRLLNPLGILRHEPEISELKVYSYISQTLITKD